MFPPVKTSTLGRVLSPLLFCAVLLTCAAKVPDLEPVVPLGDNTYSVVREASNTFMRDIEKLKAEARDAAEKFCSAQGKQMKEVSLVTEKPWPTIGLFKATLVFKAIKPGEQEPTPTVPSVAAVVSSNTAAGSDDFYSALIKLDDLRKKGILTDKEFDAQKKRILKNSK